MEINKEIFLKCKKMERAAQEQLYSSLYTPLLSICRRYLFNEQDAVVVFNNAMFKVFTKIDQFQGDHNNFYAWIKKIVINEAIDELRRNENFFSLEDIPNSENISAYDHSTNESDIDIHYLLAQLPIMSATVFNMYVLEGYSHKEISQALNITEGNSKWHLHSSRKKLQHLLTLTTVDHG